MKTRTFLLLALFTLLSFKVEASHGASQVTSNSKTTISNRFLGFPSKPSRSRRSPQFPQMFLVQGISRPFCNLFGNAGCAPHLVSQCSGGYKYDFSAQRCRKIGIGGK
ncbi:hypothetical protein JTE90_012530 [Oedothorax gibbosus]|uniref:Chitin-binding type-2 domain-containing protein n=1 Tax=Oedothorax gibbosus TaxID=931172 RepID=A0AAV6U5A8_9ARAC|nr:hypothetical protein JTE90_012530 [Oedothorax gibbosus]